MSIEIMFNARYGDFSFSDAAMDEYCKRSPEKENVKYWTISRHDPVMVQIVKEMGVKAWGARAKIELLEIPSKYLGYYSIRDYNGAEDVVIDFSAYRIETAREILMDQDLTKSEKLRRLSDVFYTDLLAESNVSNKVHWR